MVYSFIEYNCDFYEGYPEYGNCNLCDKFVITEACPGNSSSEFVDLSCATALNDVCNCDSDCSKYIDNDCDTYIEPIPESNFGPIAAFIHYYTGSGDSVEILFDDVDTANLRVTEFQQVKNAISNAKVPVFISIYDTYNFSTDGLEAAYLGTITLLLNGELQVTGMG